MAGGVRIGVAFDDPTLEPTPTWTYLTATDNLVAGYTKDVGRQFEFDRTDTGTATVTINDQDGVLDPTNSGGPYYTKIEPLLQIQIELLNPVTSVYHTRFRGFIRDFNYGVSPSQNVTRLEIDCVDLFEILTAIEMLPGQFGDTAPVADYGDIFFDNASAHDRVVQVMGNAGIPTEFYVVFTLNVDMQEYSYAAAENVLQVVQDVADAEFPTVSNVYCDRTGRLAVHGRDAKFHPVTTAAGAGAAWLFNQWKAGDGTAVAASLSDTAQIRTFSFNLGLSKVFNSAFCTPNKISTADKAAQLQTDPTSIGQYGIRSWSAENLLILDGTTTGLDAKGECFLFAQYIINNYAAPHKRITDLTFKSLHPDDPRAAANWKLLCECDIADTIEVTVDNPGGGGYFAEDGFIEGVHEEVLPLNGEFALVTTSLDVSPLELYDDDSGLFG